MQHHYYYYAYAGSVDRIFLPLTLGGGKGVVVKMCGSKAVCLSSLFSRLMWLSAAREPVR